MASDTVEIQEREGGSLSISVEHASFGASWTIRERGSGEWQALVATDGGGGSHGLFETRDDALRYVLEKAGVLDDAE